MSFPLPLSHHRDDDPVWVQGFGIITRKEARDQALLHFMQTSATGRDPTSATAFDDLTMAYMKAAISERCDRVPVPWPLYTLD